MSILGNLVDLAIPQSCAGCGRSRFRVCPICATFLDRDAHQVVVKGADRSCFPIVATAHYEGPAKNILLAAKERNQVSLIPVIARLTLVAVSSLLKDVSVSGPLLLIPTPSRSSNIHSRGYDLVLQISELVAVQLRKQRVDVQVLPILKHSRPVKDQSGLSAMQRATNVQNAFTSTKRKGFENSNQAVVIIDDLVTTGSTLIEVRRSLLWLGAQVLGAACAMSSR